MQQGISGLGRERCFWTDVSSHPGATTLAAPLPCASSSSTISSDSHETQCPGGVGEARGQKPRPSYR
jgi:hypothetical protein